MLVRNNRGNLVEEKKKRKKNDWAIRPIFDNTKKKGFIFKKNKTKYIQSLQK